MDHLEFLKYPIGPMERIKEPLGAAGRSAHLTILEHTPDTVRDLVEPLSDQQLDTPYRPGGWTIRQVVHHLPDSHMHAYIRMKWAATEDAPAVKTYNEKAWAELGEARTGPIDMSLALLDSLHERWVSFLRALPEPQFRRHFMHGEWGPVTIEESLTMYSWHCRHHTEHIRRALA